jgi:hypothetical protein
MYKMHNFKIGTIFVIALLVAASGRSQEYKATAKIDSSSILIGDYLNVQLHITAPQNAPLIIQPLSPALLDSLHLELIGYSAIDTAYGEANVNYRQIITVTSFDSGSYIFPSILILDSNTNLLAATEPLPFWVNTIAVDTTVAIRDIKQIVKAPLTFRELLPITLMALAITIAVVAIVVLYLKYGNRKKRKKPAAAPKVPKEKAHVVALQALEQLRLKKLWENGLVKLYYSELTDILRSYIESRYEVDAREMVTTEIMEAIADKSIDLNNLKELEQLLATADLVKFAKWSPLPNDNDLYFKNARHFIENTAEIVADPDKKPKKA